MRKYTGPALFAIVLTALVMAASPVWAQERVPDGDPSRDTDVFTCPEGTSAVPNPDAPQGFTCVDDPVDPETGEPVEESPTTTTAGRDDEDPEPPEPTTTTVGGGGEVPPDTPPGRGNPCREGTVPASPNWEDSDVVECVPATTTTSEDTSVPTTSAVGTVDGGEVVGVIDTAPTTTVQSGQGELPFTGNGSAVLVAGLTFLAVGTAAFLVAGLKPKR